MGSAGVLKLFAQLAANQFSPHQRVYEDKNRSLMSRALSYTQRPSTSDALHPAAVWQRTLNDEPYRQAGQGTRFIDKIVSIFRRCSLTREWMRIEQTNLEIMREVSPRGKENLNPVEIVLKYSRLN